MPMESGEQLHRVLVLIGCGDVGGRGLEAALRAEHTLLGRPGWSKPTVRVGASFHEESKVAR